MARFHNILGFGHRQARHRRSCRPSTSRRIYTFQELEPRNLLTTVNVTTLVDVLDGDTSSIAALISTPGADGSVSLREAIIAANNTGGADTITLGPGTYQLSLGGLPDNSAARGDLDVRDDLTLIGAGARSTVIDGNNLDRVFELINGALHLDGLTLANGFTLGDGGAIQGRGGTSLSLTNVSIAGSQAGRGGAVYSIGDVSLDRVTISGNSALTAGGAIYYAGNSNLMLQNGTISGNASLVAGGGIWSNAAVTITNATIAFNNSIVGGGVFVQGGAGASQLRNSILANNTGGNSNTALGSLGNNISNGTGVFIVTTGDQEGVNPMLDPALSDNGGPTDTHALLAGSPAIDQGNDAGAPASDQRGFTRIGTSDVGAFEFTASANQTPTTTGLSAVNVLEDAADTLVNLFAAFADVEDADADLTYAIVGNTNPLLSAGLSIDGVTGILTLQFATDAHGSSVLTVRASDSGGLFVDAVFTVTVAPVADAPSVTNATTTEETQTTTGLVITPNASDGAEVTHFKITGLVAGTLFLSDGTTSVANGQFITIAQGAAGLKFTPAAGSTATGSFMVQAATAANDGALGVGITMATVTVTPVPNDPPAKVLEPGPIDNPVDSPVDSSPPSLGSGQPKLLLPQVADDDIPADPPIPTVTTGDDTMATVDSGADAVEPAEAESDAPRRQSGGSGSANGGAGSSVAEPDAAEPTSQESTPEVEVVAVENVQAIPAETLQPPAPVVANAEPIEQQPAPEPVPAVEATVPATSQSARYTVNVVSAATGSSRLAVGTTYAIATVLTAGYVIWAVRGGMLISSLLTQLPAWRMLDILPVLDSFDKAYDATHRHGRPEEDATDSLFDRGVQTV